MQLAKSTARRRNTLKLTNAGLIYRQRFVARGLTAASVRHGNRSGILVGGGVAWGAAPVRILDYASYLDEEALCIARS